MNGGSEPNLRVISSNDSVGVALPGDPSIVD